MSEDIIEKIIQDRDVSEGKAKKIYKGILADVHCIVAFYHYYEWAKDRFIDYDIKHLDILEGKPYYKQNPILNVSASHIVQLSRKSLFREFCRETSCKYNIEQVLFCNTSEINALNRVLTKLKNEVKNETNNY